MQQFRRAKRAVDGVLLLDKPSGISSNGALQRAKRLLGAAKAGHTGTLDPMASGLLPLTFGEATKFSQMLLDADKEYEAEVRLGIETDTGDAEGEVCATADVSVDAPAVERALAAFRGGIEQIPPMFSALKRNGKPLYEYARAGVELEREARRVTIHALQLLSLDLAQATFRIRVACSKGTYIRTLAMDIGSFLGCGAHLTALRRTGIGAFRCEDAVALARMEAFDEAGCEALLCPADALVAHLPGVALADEQAAGLLQGRVLEQAPAGTPGGLVRLYAGERFLGLGFCTDDGKLSSKRLIATGNTGDFRKNPVNPQ